MSRVLGAVLAGGASSRFGSDKAAAIWAGMPLVDHAAAAIAPFVTEVVRIGGAGGIPDLPGADLGPLGGIAAALDHGSRHGFASVLTIACDTPLLPDGLIEALLRRAPAWCTDAPVLGYWPSALAAALIGRLSPRAPSPRACPGVHGAAHRAPDVGVEGWMPEHVRHDGEGERHHRDAARSIRRWAEDIGALPVASPAPIANVNTPADLLAL